MVVVLRPDDPLLHATPVAGIRFVAGGSTRSESARAGLAAVPGDAQVILIHDAARPLAGLDGVVQVFDEDRKGRKPIGVGPARLGFCGSVRQSKAGWQPAHLPGRGDF